MVLKIVAIFREFFSGNKAKNAGCFRKNAGRKAKCWISRTIAGWLTPMILQWAVKTIAKCFNDMYCMFNLAFLPFQVSSQKQPRAKCQRVICDRVSRIWEAYNK